MNTHTELPELPADLLAEMAPPIEPLTHDEVVVIAATDPLNLVGTISPGPRVPAVAGNRILVRDGVPIASLESGAVIARASDVDPAAVSAYLQAAAPRPRGAPANPQDWL